MYFKYTYSLRTSHNSMQQLNLWCFLTEMLFNNVTCLYTYYYTSYPDVIQQRLCSCFLFLEKEKGNLWMRELLKFQRALWFCFWCWWEIIWVLIDTKELILHLVTMIRQKKLIFCLLLIQNTSPLIKDSDEDSKCVDNDTEQLIVLLFSLIVIQPVLCQRMLFQYS